MGSFLCWNIWIHYWVKCFQGKRWFTMFTGNLPKWQESFRIVQKLVKSCDLCMFAGIDECFSFVSYCFTFSRTLLNPIDFGFPNTRLRFYLLAKRRSLGEEPCPSGPPTVQPRPVSHFLEEKKLYRLAVSNLDWFPSESEFLLVHPPCHAAVGGGKPAKTSCTARARRGFAKGLGWRSQRMGCREGMTIKCRVTV